jgi:ubiquinone/menaquinone biosynthesis C-methylase UbiE
MSCAPAADPKEPTMADTSGRSYVPAAGKHWRLPFYDLMAKALGADAARRVLAEQAAVRAGERVLEIGCGTGSLLLLVATAQPAAEIIGLDPDPNALAIAQRKARRAGVTFQLDQGFADEMPYEAGSIDRVLSSFMFHHLPAEVKARTLREVRRVLKPGGRFHMVDFGGPSSGGRGFIARHIHADRHLRDNDEGRILTFLRETGLENPQVAARRPSHLGSMVYYVATAPA